MLPSTPNRVREHTPHYINERIERLIEQNIAYYAAHPGQIDQRLAELDQEWDIDRALETHAASVALGGLVLGSRFGRKWFLLPGLVAGFLLQYTLQGWSPPMTILRRLGLRTRSEIEQERYALKSLRGDFSNIPAHPEFQQESAAAQILRAVKRDHEGFQGQQS
jgi:hypothetical protein